MGQTHSEDLLLVERSKQDHEEFGLLYTKYAARVYTYVLRRASHKEIAEDVTQETFVHALEHISNYTWRGNSYLAYLLTIAHNILVNYYRDKKPLPLDEAFVFSDNNSAADEILRQIEVKIEMEALREELGCLNHAEREILWMKYQVQLPVKEIAEFTQKSENAVKLVLSRSRKKLANHPSLQWLHSV